MPLVQAAVAWLNALVHPAHAKQHPAPADESGRLPVQENGLRRRMPPAATDRCPGSRRHIDWSVNPSAWSQSAAGALWRQPLDVPAATGRQCVASQPDDEPKPLLDSEEPPRSADRMRRAVALPRAIGLRAVCLGDRRDHGLGLRAAQSTSEQIVYVADVEEDAPARRTGARSRRSSAISTSSPRRGRGDHRSRPLRLRDESTRRTARRAPRRHRHDPGRRSATRRHVRDRRRRLPAAGLRELAPWT